MSNHFAEIFRRIALGALLPPSARRCRAATSLMEGGENSALALGALLGGSWHEEYSDERLRELLPPSARLRRAATSIMEGGKGVVRAL